MTADTSSNEMRRPESPQRFFLNAPKQRDGECYVLNWDYMELDAFCVRLLQERDSAYEAGWRMAANWAKRDDLLADIGSAAYERDKAEALTACGAVETTEPQS